MARTRKLDPVETRILGALLEKEQTTPDYYPMTINALLAACNQKSNRNPVMKLGEEALRDAIERLRQDVLVWRTDGARAARWKHSLDRRWELEPPDKAVMTLLMLRGPQTPGELRIRSERMYNFPDVSDTESCLKALAERFDALVVELPRQPGQRENRWAQLMTEGEDHEAMEASLAAPAPRASAGPSKSDHEERLQALESTVAELRQELARLRQQVED